MRRAIALLIVIIMIVPAVACSKRENNSNNDSPITIQPTITTEPTVTVGPTVTVDAAVTPEKPEETEDCCKSISIRIIPMHDGITDKNGKEVVSIDYDTASVFIDEQLVGYFGKALQEEADSFLEFFYNFNAEEASQTDADYKYIADYKISPQRMDEAVVSFVLTEYTYTMGAHGNGEKLAVNYDIENQFEVKLEDITGDYPALEKLLHEYVLKLMLEHEYSAEFFPGYEDTISYVVTDGMWYFSDEGITFICNPYVVAPYAVGIMEFTVPYEELSGYINERWLPREHKGGAEDIESVSIYTDYDTSGYKVTRLDLDAEGRTFAIATDKTIYDVTLSSVTYDSESNDAWVNRVIYKCSRLTSKELLEITADIPELTPNLQLTYKLVDGSMVTNYIYESGKDGSLFLR